MTREPRGQAQADGYATAIAVLALQRNGDAAASTAAASTAAACGLDWLRRHQDPTTGLWTASSLDKQRHPSMPAAGFMSDAATGFAVPALSGPSR